MARVYVAIWFVLSFCCLNGQKTKVQTIGECMPRIDPPEVRPCCELLANDSLTLLKYLAAVEASHGNLRADSYLPSIYTYKAVALFEQRRMHEARDALQQAVAHNPLDLRAWSNLAEMQAMFGQTKESNISFEKAEQLSGKGNIGLRYSRVRWDNVENLVKEEQRLFVRCYESRTKEHCEDAPFSSSMDFAELDGAVKKELEVHFARDICSGLPTVHVPNPGTAVTSQSTRKTTVGFLLACVDGGPVNALLQALLRNLDRRRVTVVAFVLSENSHVDANWVIDFLREFDELISLQGLSDQHSAELVARRGVDVLIDTNGYNFLTGIHILKYRPSLIQVNFLGDPTTSALSAVDYYIGDQHANSADITAAHFSEKFALLPACYLANSHRSWTPDLLIRPRQTPAALALSAPSGGSMALPSIPCKSCVSGRAQPLLLGTFHTYNKFDMSIVHVWMNILRRSPLCALVFNSYPSDPDAMQNIVKQALYHGVAQSDVLFLALTKWYAHVHQKTALDMYLDTYRKNGHTTTVDAAWAGLPTVALGAQATAGRRSAESVLRYSAHNEHGLVYSLKECEDLVVGLTATLRGRKRLSAWRQYTERVRLAGELFDEPHYADAFLRTLEVMQDASLVQHPREGDARDEKSASSKLSRNSVLNTRTQNYHVFTAEYE